MGVHGGLAVTCWTAKWEVQSSNSDHCRNLDRDFCSMHTPGGHRVVDNIWLLVVSSVQLTSPSFTRRQSWLNYTVTWLAPCVAAVQLNSPPLIICVCLKPFLLGLKSYARLSALGSVNIAGDFHGFPSVVVSLPFVVNALACEFLVFHLYYSAFALCRWEMPEIIILDMVGEVSIWKSDFQAGTWVTRIDNLRYCVWESR